MVLTRSRRILLVIIGLAIVGIFGIRRMGNAALEKAITRFTTEGGVPLTVKSFGPGQVDKKQNMALLVESAAKLTDVSPEERTFLSELMHKNPTQMDQQTLGRVQSLIQRNEFALQILSKAAPLTDSSFGLHYWQGIEMPIPNLLEFLQMIRLNSAKWRIELQNGDPESARQTALLQERIASALTHEPIAIMCLIGFVAEKDYYEFLHRTIGTSDESLLQTDIDSLNHLKAMATPLQNMIATDGAMVYSSISSEFRTIDYFRQGSISDSQWMSLKTSYLLNRPYFLANLLENYIELLQHSRKPVTKNGQSPVNDTWVSRMFFSSAVDTLIRRFQVQDAARDLAMIAIQTRLEGLKNGSYRQPNQLPVSEYIGERASYRVLPDGRAELSFPQTIRLWDQKSPEYATKPRLTWILPKI